jgi:hypothetical protein
MDSITKRLEMLEALKPQKGTAPSPYAARFDQIGNDALDILVSVVEIIRWSAPEDPFPDGTKPEYPMGYYSRILGFQDAPPYDHKITGAQIQLLMLALEDLILGKPPVSDEAFIERVKSIMKGAL